MQLIDEQYLRTPFYGSPRITAHLHRHGYVVNHKRIQRLMRKKGLQAFYPKPRTSRGSQARKVYRYLLRGLEVTRPNFVWSTDIARPPRCILSENPCCCCFSFHPILVVAWS